MSMIPAQKRLTNNERRIIASSNLQVAGKIWYKLAKRPSSFAIQESGNDEVPEVAQ